MIFLIKNRVIECPLVDNTNSIHIVESERGDADIIVYVMKGH